MIFFLAFVTFLAALALSLAVGGLVLIAWCLRQAEANEEGF